MPNILPGVEVNIKNFENQVKGFENQLVPEAFLDLHKRTHREALRRIVDLTPVRTGTARQSWQTTLGSRPAKNRKVDPFEVSERKLARLRPFGKTLIVSVLRYMPFLERGTSKQAPRGIVRVVREEFEGRVEKANV